MSYPSYFDFTCSSKNSCKVRDVVSESLLGLQLPIDFSADTQKFANCTTASQIHFSRFLNEEEPSWVWQSKASHSGQPNVPEIQRKLKGHLTPFKLHEKHSNECDVYRKTLPCEAAYFQIISPNLQSQKYILGSETARFCPSLVGVRVWHSYVSENHKAAVLFLFSLVCLLFLIS